MNIGKTLQDLRKEKNKLKKIYKMFNKKTYEIKTTYSELFKNQ